MTNQNEQTITITLNKKDRGNLIKVLDYANSGELKGGLEGWYKTNERVMKQLKRKSRSLKK